MYLYIDVTDSKCQVGAEPERLSNLGTTSNSDLYSATHMGIAVDSSTAAGG